MNQNDITYQDKLNELRLDISHPNSKGVVFVFVEGESDIRLFRKLFNLQYCKVEFVPGGKFKLEDCVATLSGSYTLIIGIIDADFIHLKGTKPTKSNIFATDRHDIEMTIIAEDEVFSSLMSEHTSEGKENHLDIRLNILNSIELLSLLKFLNEIEDLKYNFKHTGFRDLLLFSDFSLDFKTYFSRVLSKSSDNVIIDYNSVMQKIHTLKASNPDLFQLCNGHDYINALSQYLMECGSSRSIDYQGISSSLRMAFTECHYKKTNLYQSTKSWADSHGCIIY